MFSVKSILVWIENGQEKCLTVFVKFIQDAKVIKTAVRLARKRLCLPENAIFSDLSSENGLRQWGLIQLPADEHGCRSYVEIENVPENIAKMLRNGKSNVLYPTFLTSAAD